MILSKTYEKINQCLELSESFNLTNREEEKVTLELVRNFKKLMALILTKTEKNKFKNKTKLILNHKNLIQLEKKLDHKHANLKWQSYLGLKSNVMLKLAPQKLLTSKLIIKDIEHIIKVNYPPNKKNLYIIEHQQVNTVEEAISTLTKIKNKIKLIKIEKIIIPSKCIGFMKNITVNSLLNDIVKEIIDSFFIEISREKDFDHCLEFISSIATKNSRISYGLSLAINHRKTIKHVDTIFSKLNEKQLQRFILRVTKESELKIIDERFHHNNQQIKINTYYKWSIFTIINYTRKFNVNCIINSSNIYDISWILILRAQMNVEKNITFETNMTKFPNISKLLLMVSRSTIHSKSIMITENVLNNLQIILSKLIKEGVIYEGYKFSKMNQKIIFKKSHRQFFNYLRRNYLEKYLNKFDD